MELLKRTFAQINFDNLENNFNIIKQKTAPNVKIMCVIKADAYGHGAVPVAKFLESKADYFAVSNIEEAIELRQADIKTPILILSYTPVKFADKLAQFDITQALISKDYAIKLSSVAKENNLNIKCHIKIDTGMNRVGFEYDDEFLSEVPLLKGLEVEGAFTHFACADKDGDKSGRFTSNQFEKFKRALGLIESKGFKIKLKHCCNSAATLDKKEYHLDMVRPGIILYGLQPSKDIDTSSFKPVMSLKCFVSMVKKLHKGECVSYGATFKAKKDMTVATLPVGYADGFIRAFAKGGQVLFKGKRADIIGRICMDQCLIDASDLDLKSDDEVTLFGYENDELLPVDNLAKSAGTINYEIVCLITKRVSRVYVKDGKTVEIVGLLH